MVSSVTLRDVGPFRSLTVDFARRVTVLRGPCGSGKTVAMDSLWWLLTGCWVGYPAMPLFGRGDASIACKVGDDTNSGKWQWRQEWDKFRGRRSSRPVVYFRDGGFFGVYLPPCDARNRNPKGDSDTLVLAEREIWDGRKGKHLGEIVTDIQGLVSELNDWMFKNGREIEMVNAMLRSVLPVETFSGFGLPRRFLLRDARDFPTMRLPGGHPATTEIGRHRAMRRAPTRPNDGSVGDALADICVDLAPSTVRRAVSMAYFVVWTWMEAVFRAESVGHQAPDGIVLLVDTRITGDAMAVLRAVQEAIPGIAVQIIAEDADRRTDANSLDIAVDSVVELKTPVE